VVLGRLGGLEDGQGSALQVLDPVEEAIGTGGAFGIAGKGEEGRKVLAYVVAHGTLGDDVLRRYAPLRLRMDNYRILYGVALGVAADCAHPRHGGSWSPWGVAEHGGPDNPGAVAGTPLRHRP
jgi:hypothetical protein